MHDETRDDVPDGQPADEQPAEKPPVDGAPTQQGLPDDVAAIRDSLGGDTGSLDPFSSAQTAILPVTDFIPESGSQSEEVLEACDTPPAVDEAPQGHSNVWTWVGVTAAILLIAGAGGFVWWHTTSRPVAVPDIVGKLPAQAVQTLNDADLRLGKVTEEETDTAPPGTIIAQTPRPNSKLKPNAQVSFVLAAAPTSAEVPAVAGRALADAQRTLAESRLTAHVVESYNATAVAGFVIQQLPAPGAKIEPGEPVVLAVSRGALPSQVRAPKLIGLAEEDASVLLREAGLQGIPCRSYNSSITAGEVVTQTPNPRTQLPFDSFVQYWISQGAGSTSVTIPNVSGSNRKDAEKLLKARGLKPEVRRISSTTVAKGKVISQMPPAGARTVGGGMVGLLVSDGNLASGSAPDLLGKPSIQADELVKKGGFTPVFVEIATPEHAAGQVFGQYPQANTLWPLRFPMIAVVAKSP